MELGCGTGNKLIPIASDGQRCVGPDISAEARLVSRSSREDPEPGVSGRLDPGS